MKMYDNFYWRLGQAKLLLAFSLLLPSNHLAATEYSRTQLSEQVVAFLQSQLAVQDNTDVKITMHPIDARIGSKFCQSPLQLQLVNPQIQNQNSVKVQCVDEQGWQIYLNAKVSKMVQALVSARQLAPGSVITAEAIYSQSREQSQSRGLILQDPALVIGARTKRSLNIGQIITNADLCLVCKGDIVTIEGISNSLVVSTAGKALSDGALGDNVRVQNLQSGRVVVASVSAIKKVAINL